MKILPHCQLIWCQLPKVCPYGDEMMFFFLNCAMALLLHEPWQLEKGTSCGGTVLAVLRYQVMMCRFWSTCNRQGNITVLKCFFLYRGCKSSAINEKDEKSPYCYSNLRTATQQASINSRMPITRINFITAKFDTNLSYLTL